jgi:hypothetical protein
LNDLDKEVLNQQNTLSDLDAKNIVRDGAQDKIVAEKMNKIDDNFLKFGSTMNEIKTALNQNGINIKSKESDIASLR